MLTSADPTVRYIAEVGLQAELESNRKKFQPTVVVQQTLQEDPGHTRKTLSVAAKRIVKSEDNGVRLEELKALPQQGQLARTATAESATILAESLKALPSQDLKFVLNAMHDTLPHNANLNLWKKRDTKTCLLCKEDEQNLIHVLNNCQTALNLRRYNNRHDHVLSTIASTIKKHLPSTVSMTTDLSEGYSFPSHIVQTDL